MSTVTYFPLEPGCEDDSVLDQAFKDFELGLDSILTDPVNTPELEASFDEADAISSSVSSVFLCLLSTHSDNSGLQLAPGIKCYTLWCQARALPLLVPQVGKMSVNSSFFLSTKRIWTPCFFGT